MSCSFKLSSANSGCFFACSRRFEICLTNNFIVRACRWCDVLCVGSMLVLLISSAGVFMSGKHDNVVMLMMM